MKFKLKLLAAAAALAVAGQAAAAIPLNNTATGTGLLFYAFDDATKTSYVQELGFTYSSFLPSTANAQTSHTFAVSANSAWSDYLASVGSDTSNTFWGVIAGISASAAQSTNGFMSTVRVGDSTVGQTVGNARGGVATPLRNVVLGINSATAGAGAPNGYFSDSAAGDNIANNFQHNGGGRYVFNVTNAIGTSSEFQWLNSTGSQPVYTSYSPFTFSFNGEELIYSAVPEPGTYAMMLAGLALVGGVAARRRKAAK